MSELHTCFDIGEWWETASHDCACSLGYDHDHRPDRVEWA